MYNTSQTKILASVKSAEEAMLVLEKGVDIIDFKNPSLGSLGGLSINKIRSCLKIIPNNQLTSATIGDESDIKNIKKKAISLSKTNIDFIKIGFFFDKKKLKNLFGIKNLIKNKKIIAVLFADRKPELSLIDKIRRIHFDGILIDTENKINGNLRNYLDNEYIKDFIRLSKEANLTIGLAGSLTINDIGPLIKLHPDYIGFRGALCGLNERKADICEKSLNSILSRFRSFSFQESA